MKKLFLLMCLLTALLLGGCVPDASFGVIGGADGPMVMIVTGPDGAAE